MNTRFRSTTYANVTATLALVVALSGGAYATAGHHAARSTVSRGTFSGFLPTGQTERGGWGQSATAPDAGAIQTSAISYPLPLAKNVKLRVIKQGASSTSACPGKVSRPKAAKGFLCIYVGNGTNRNAVSAYGEVDGLSNFRFGAVVYWSAVTTGDFTYASGTYAVTAP